MVMRTIAYNVHGWAGYPKGAFKDKSLVEVGELFAKSLVKYEPDIITFSEAPLCPTVDIIARRLNMKVVVFPSSWCWPGVLLTKYEVLEVKGYSLLREYWSKGLFTRHYGKATLLTEFGEVVLYSLHLYPDPKSEVHKLEVLEVIKELKTDIGEGRLVLVQGDLNHEPTDSAYNGWMKIKLIDAFIKAGSGKGYTFKVGSLDRRIDYVLISKNLAKHLTECHVLSEPPFNVKIKEEVALSDHLPIMAIFD